MTVVAVTNNRYVVDAVARALDILDAFEGQDSLTLGQIRQSVGLNKSRVFRMVQTLAARGYLQRCPDSSSYRLGMKLAERASHVHKRLGDAAREPMLHLYERFREAVSLGVLDDDHHLVCVKVVESSRPSQSSRGVGHKAPAQKTAAGKAMLAFQHTGYREQVERFLGQNAWALHRELEIVRGRGYSVCREEPASASIAAPVLDLTGHAIATLSVSGPLLQILSQEAEISAAVMAACRRTARLFGGEPAVRMPGAALMAGHAGRMMAAK